MTWAKPALMLLVAAVVTVRPMSHGAAETAVEPVAGELLIASAAIQDPRFHHSVILLLRHDEKGAFGIVINHPLTERPIAGLLAASPRDRGDDPRLSRRSGRAELRFRHT